MSTDLERRLSNERWFHSIDMGDFATSGRFKPGEPQNATLYGFMDLIKEIDLSGMTVLDVGCSDGLASFGMRALGASQVHSTNSFGREKFAVVRDALGLDGIDYHPDLQLKDMVAHFGRGQFDLILCAGVIYHMINPASAFTECRKLLKAGGYSLWKRPIIPMRSAPLSFSIPKPKWSPTPRPIRCLPWPL
ncbi:class I SAM-dependent methyltransferase [Methyloligella halotolerans]|uniref:class I SAM-dependent methyltransferase n=1 Tax=Methyloligella halotolerans TaxID=1177755 RepID=UPI00083E03D8|nr:methyltransferase domain-containing protein [Methyloligella halotolerans]